MEAFSDLTQEPAGQHCLSACYRNATKINQVYDVTTQWVTAWLCLGKDDVPFADAFILLQGKL